MKSVENRTIPVVLMQGALPRAYVIVPVARTATEQARLVLETWGRITGLVFSAEQKLDLAEDRYSLEVNSPILGRDTLLFQWINPTSTF
jgi:hypothetical protein